MMNMKEEKRRMRKEVRDATQALPDEYIIRAGAAICAGLTALPEYATARTIFCFAGTEREPATLPFLAQALRQGKRVCLPLCLSLGQMELRQITDIEQLSPGAYGIPEPPQTAPRLRPDQVDMAVIPCLSCDHSGNRLGKGGGFYDRFLSQYKGFSVMICPERLTRPAIPMENHDQPVPCVLTEQGLYRV